MAMNNFLIIVKLMIDNDRAGETIGIGSFSVLINSLTVGEVWL